MTILLSETAKNIIIIAVTVFFVILAIFFLYLMFRTIFSRNRRSPKSSKIKLDNKKIDESHLRNSPLIKEEKITNQNIKEISNRYKEAFSSIDSVLDFAKKEEETIRDISSNIVNEKTLEALKEIPIEELNKDKIGIRVKPLRNKGIKTIYDAYILKNKDFSRISGISYDNSKLINKKLDQIVSRTKEGVKVTLNADSKKKSDLELIKHLDIYNSSLEAINKAKELSERRKEIDNLIKNSKRDPDSLNKLIDTYNNDFTKINRDIISPINKNKKKNYIDSKEDFKKESAKYGVSLGNINKNNKSEKSSLTPQIAKLVASQELDLKGFKLTLRDYQSWGAKFLIKQRKTILGDEMGLGKTVQAIASLTHLRNKGEKYFMVISPLSVLTNWSREIEKFSDLSFIKIYGNDKQESFSYWLNHGGVALTTYETLSSLNKPNDLKIDMLIVDEAHMVKNKNAARSQKTKEYVDSSNRICYMTGTVIENNLGEMIKLIEDLNPNLAHELNSQKVYFNDEIFKKLVAPIYFRRKREDVLTELPEKIENEEWCDLSLKEAKTYKENVLNHKFAQARRVSFDVPLSESSKMARLMEIIDMAKLEDRKVLVFSFFLDTIFSLKEYLGDRALSPIYGEIPTEKRQAIIDEFNNSPGGTVLLTQIVSGGTGLNIQSASVVVITEPQFKPSIENQAISRAYRMGQARNVLVYRLLATNTVDERITQILKNKQNEFNAYADESVSASSTFEVNQTSIFEEEVKKLSSED